MTGFKKTLRVLGAGCAWTAGGVVLAWLAGRVLSDRFGWSQWLLWIPTPAALLAVGLGLLGAGRPASQPDRRRRRLQAWGVCGAAMLVYFTAIENRFFRGPAPPGPGLRIVHCNVQPIGRRTVTRFVDKLVELDGDLSILSSPLAPARLKELAERLAESGQSVMIWPFVIFSREPVLEARPIVANEGIRIVLLRFQVATLRRPITVYAVDLPSDPRLPRIEVARNVRRLLDGVDAPQPDIVIGDFNMTRGSAALKALFPGLADAYDQAGRGYGASFRRDFPLYHIDHTLIGGGLRAADYVLVDPGLGRHLIQVVWVEEGDG